MASGNSLVIHFCILANEYNKENMLFTVWYRETLLHGINTACDK